MKEIVGNDIGIWHINYKCTYRAKDGHLLYNVTCNECGYETEMIKSHITFAKTCTHKNKNGKLKEFNTYRWQNKRIGKTFRGMLDRCYNKNSKSYKFYGMKGIKVYEKWIENPKCFEVWAIKNGYKDNLTIDRIDSRKDYFPDNCRWITMEENARYKSSTSIIAVDGETHTGRDWSKILYVGINTINTMIRRHGEERTKEFIRARYKDIKSNKNYLKNRKVDWFKFYKINKT